MKGREGAAVKPKGGASAGSAPQSVTRAQAIAGTGNISETDEGKDATVASAEHIQVEVDGRRQYFTLQERWSNAIISWIEGLLVVNCLIMIFAGLGILNYEKTPWLITAFVTEIFLQVIGLGYIAARFLFPGSRGKVTKRLK